MKRLNEDQNQWLKRGRFNDGNGESSDDVAEDPGTGDSSNRQSVVPPSSEDQNRGGVKSIGLDLGNPVQCSSEDNESKEGIRGSNVGELEKGEEFASREPDFGGENLNHVACGSALVTGGEGRYTREEKGKASVTDSTVAHEFDLIPIVDIASGGSSDKAELGDSEPNVNNAVTESFPGDEQRYTWEEKGKDVATDGGLSEESDLYGLELLMTCALNEPEQRAPQVIPAARDAEHYVELRAQAKSSDCQTLGAQEQLGTSPGPFSEALEKVRKREQLIEWKPSAENKGHAPFVPSLMDLSLKALVENPEEITSFQCVPDNVVRRLVDLLCDTNKMNGRILSLLVKNNPTAIRIKNCSWLTEEELLQSLATCRPEVLQLDLSGRILFDFVFRDFPHTFSSLIVVSLRGACHFTDNGLKDLVTSASALRSMNLGQCTLLTSEAIRFIADILGSNLRELYIDYCHNIDAAVILAYMKKFTHLEVLSVAGSLTVTDQFIRELVTVCGQSIKELELADCQKLSDMSLNAIGSSCAGLCSLNIENVHNLTDMGIEYLANGCRSIRNLKLSYNGFSDEAVAAFLETSGESLEELSLNKVTKVGPNTAISLAKHSRNLLYLDVSWCRKIRNEALGLVVDSCSSLKLLKIFGCRQITSLFLNGHSNSSVRIIGASMTPIFDHLNLFEPEEMFLRYSSL